ncbi:signal peptidase I [Streptomyces hoynatensis]|uniref:signal peptidase I n=1 Tax=Streptomyces hoynatensis TaxID=1141874 RepID=UPI001F4E163B|nr:signal peptidase I [Streptomyces hoynatensis]
MGERGRRRPGRRRGEDPQEESPRAYEPPPPAQPPAREEPPARGEPAPAGEPAALGGPAAFGEPEPAGQAASAGDEPPGEEPPAPLRGPGEGRADRRRAARRIKRRRRARATREIPILVGTALLIALVLKTFLVQAFVIPSGSMEQTIRISDRVLVDKLTPWFGWEPSRGDVVVFEDPGGWLEPEQPDQDDDPVVIRQVKEALTWIGLLPSADDQDLIKRVVGVGGDTVACCDEQGRVTVNGTPLDEPYLYPGNPPSQIEFEVKVPEGRLFVMGDHRSNSADSRYHLEDEYQGTVPESQVVGRAVVIAWPFSHWSGLGDSGAFSAVADAPPTSADALERGWDAGADKEFALLPTPGELPLVMGVVGLLRYRRGPELIVRSGCGGSGGGRPSRRGRPGGQPGEPGRLRVRRWLPRRRAGRRGPR